MFACYPLRILLALFFFKVLIYTPLGKQKSLTTFLL